MPLLQAARLGGLILSLLLAACATAPQTERLLSAPVDLPRSHELTHVAFHPQERYQCGPAALAIVLNETGVAVTPDALVNEVYLPAKQGSLQVEILAAARRHGRVPYLIQPRLDDLLREIAAGNPVLVLQNLGLSWLPRWHYAVVVGFDLEQREITLRSGQEPRHQLSLTTFEHTWARSGNWGVVVLAPERLPATVDKQRYLAAVTGLERAQRTREALIAYRTALTRWPGELVAQMGLGNSAYALGDLAGAEATFRAAIQDHPNAPAAHNNLAQVLMERGNLAEASQQARIAVELGGAELDVARQTLNEIEGKLRPIEPTD
jgi:tetratricopeptide (TPR) repeat protein